jgi:hypothetical protein
MSKTRGKVEVYLHPYLALAKEMVQIFLIEFPVKK